MKVVLVNGSPRRDGNTFAALQIVEKQLQANGMETETLQVGSHAVRGCTGCGKCFETGECVLSDDRFRRWVSQLYEADGIVIGSPVYYAGIAGTLKCFLDRCFYQSRGRMRHKIGAGVLVPRRSGGMPAFEQINNYFLISEMVVAPSYYWNVIHGGAKGEVLQDEEGVSVLQNLGSNMAWLLQMKEQTKDTLPPPRPVKRKWMNFIR